MDFVAIRNRNECFSLLYYLIELRLVTMTGKSTFESFWLDLCTFEEI
jgi:hypothetical protein